MKPAGPQHDFDWEFEGTLARVRHGVVYNSGTDTTGMFFTNAKRRWVVLAIRGSTTRTDTITNFSFDKVPFECPVPDMDGCKVHRGFYTVRSCVQTAWRWRDWELAPTVLAAPTACLAGIVRRGTDPSPQA